jgi:hypothetical protein
MYAYDCPIVIPSSGESGLARKSWASFIGRIVTLQARSLRGLDSWRVKVADHFVFLVLEPVHQLNLVDRLLGRFYVPALLVECCLRQLAPFYKGV